MSDESAEVQAMIQGLETRFTSGVYPKRPLALTRGRGSTVWDADGNAYMDMTSGQGVALLGHSHPKILEAIAAQSERLITCPEIFYHDQRARLYQNLRQMLPHDLGRFFLCNSGAEAIEGALKLARLKTGRSHLVAFQGGFHGRTLGALSVTWNPSYREPFEPLIPDVIHLPFNDPDELNRIVDERTAAVVVEAVQGEGGVVPADPGFLSRLRQRCDRTGALFIADEIQTGLGRTGRAFGFDHHQVVPDVVCLGKGVAGGLPMGVVAWRSSLGALPSGSHGSTFGGNPLACAAANATLGVLIEADLIGRAGEMGWAWMDELRALEHRLVREVRGAGLMVGIDLRKRSTPILKSLMAKGVLALPAGPTVLRLLPPLIVTKEELGRVRSAIVRSLDEMESA